MAQPAEHPQPLEGVVLHQPDAEPIRALCPCCLAPVIYARVQATRHYEAREVVADAHEWLPRGRCDSCEHTRNARPGEHVHCNRCNSTGLTGERRPLGEMLAIDVAWGDLVHLRIIGPRTDRRKGEAAHTLHVCQGDY